MFGDIASGIKHFSDITGVKADNLPTDKVIKENQRELQALPPLGWLSDQSSEDVLRQIVAFDQMRKALFASGASNVVVSGGVYSTPSETENDTTDPPVMTGDL